MDVVAKINDVVVERGDRVTLMWDVLVAGRNVAGIRRVVFEDGDMILDAHVSCSCASRKVALNVHGFVAAMEFVREHAQACPVMNPRSVPVRVVTEQVSPFAGNPNESLLNTIVDIARAGLPQ